MPHLPVLGAEVLEHGAVFEQVVDRNQQGVGDGDGRPLLTSPGGDAVVAGGEEIGAAAVGDRPRSLHQGVAQPAVATANTSVLALARGLVVVGEDAGPGGEVSCAREPGHVGARLGQDLLSSAGSDARNLIQSAQGGLERAHALSDALVKSGDPCFSDSSRRNWLWSMKRWWLPMEPVSARSSCGILLRRAVLASSASSAASVFPAAKLLSIERPETPITSLVTSLSLMLAPSSSFWTRCTTVARCSTRLRR